MALREAGTEEIRYVGVIRSQAPRCRKSRETRAENGLPSRHLTSQLHVTDRAYQVGRPNAGHPCDPVDRAHDGMLASNRQHVGQAWQDAVLAARSLASPLKNRRRSLDRALHLPATGTAPA